MQSSAMAGVALTLGAPITPIVGHKKPWFEISLAQWSFHRSLNRQQTPHLDNLDFARTAKTLGINGVEYVNTFFKTEARDEAYVTRMKQRADDAGVRSLLIMVDNEGALGHPNEKERRQAVQNHELWLRSARQLGCHSIRVNASSQGSREDQASRAADGLSKLCERA
ncbi:MAG: TIM barrel protein, partial [Salinibacterium sp.]|nr:TIM barrel protein [Salinibacterium sp.]